MNEAGNMTMVVILVLATLVCIVGFLITVTQPAKYGKDGGYKGYSTIWKWLVALLSFAVIDTWFVFKLAYE